MAERGVLPVGRRDGYLPNEDFGLIGDGATGALVGRDGSIDWLCVPRFDGESLVCGLLDSRRGGSFRAAPTELHAARQHYEHDTAILVTELHAAGGVVEITDPLTLRPDADLSEAFPAGRGELVRAVRILEGNVILQVEFTPFRPATTRSGAGGISIDWPVASGTRLELLASRPLDLDAGGGHRYLPAESPDGIPGDENAFLLCSFWLADNLAYQGQLDAARELFQSLCSRSNHLGLLPEQIDPSTGAFCGNFPLGLSHVGLVSTAINLNRQLARRHT